VIGGAVAAQVFAPAKLRKQNAELREEIARIESARSEDREHRRLLAENRQLEHLRKDREELSELREEIAALKAMLQGVDLAQLREENRKLAATRGRVLSRAVNAEFFDNVKPMVQEKTERLECMKKLRTLALAAFTWASDNGGLFPPDFLSLAARLPGPEALVCPSDTLRIAAADWASSTPANASYQYLSPNSSPRNPGDPEAVLFRCPIHNNVTMNDASVRQLRAADQVVQVDGKWVVEWKEPSPPSEK